jgi:hypothetical protein
MADEAAKAGTATTAAASTGADDKIIAAYKEMLTVQFIGTVGLMLVLMAILLVGYLSPNRSPPLLLLVMLAGMLGAFFSALTRLYHVDEAGAALISPTVQGLGGWYMAMYAAVPPIVGAIAAVVLYLVFVSSFVQGDLFPTIECVEGKTCRSIAELMDNYWPAEPADYGKALVWSFIAGFSERFVPDLLQTLVKKEQGKADDDSK